MPPPPRVSLTLIVKNEASNLEPCLAGIRDWVHETVVIDTGSTDGTRQIAERLGAKVFDFPWVDDFAAARNAAISHATGDWIFWLDADDRLDTENLAKLKRLFAALPDENAGYRMTCRSIDRGGSATVTDHIRLFRNRPDIRWAYRIHEQILPAIRSARGVLRESDIVVTHTGYADPVVHRRKLERNLKLLELARREHPGETAVLYHLGVNYTAVGRPADAIPVLKEGLDRAQNDDPYVRNFYGQLARAHHQSGQRPEALAVCRAGSARFADDAELLFTEATLLTEAGDTVTAEKRLLRLTDPSIRFICNDTGLTGFKARQNLGMIYRRQNRLDDAATQFARVVEESPAFAFGRLALADVRLAQGRAAEVPGILAPVAADPSAAAEAGLLIARSHQAQKDFAAARAALEPLADAYPGNMRVLALLTQVLLEQGTDRAAVEKSLRAILVVDPKHEGALNTLKQLAAG